MNGNAVRNRKNSESSELFHNLHCEFGTHRSVFRFVIIMAQQTSGISGFPGCSSVPVIPGFHSFQLSGHSGYSLVVLVSANKGI